VVADASRPAVPATNGPMRLGLRDFRCDRARGSGVHIDERRRLNMGARGDRDPVAPGPLGRIHGGVGGGNQRRAIVGVPRERGDAERDCHRAEGLTPKVTSIDSIARRMISARPAASLVSAACSTMMNSSPP